MRGTLLLGRRRIEHPILDCSPCPATWPLRIRIALLPADGMATSLKRRERRGRVLGASAVGSPVLMSRASAFENVTRIEPALKFWRRAALRKSKRPGPWSSCNPVSGSILASCSAVVTCPRVNLKSVCEITFLATNWYERARLTGVPCTVPVPILGSSVKNDSPALIETRGAHLAGPGITETVVLGEFTPIHW